jgi:O-antigen/teichoic acid export membrane protein
MSAKDLDAPAVAPSAPDLVDGEEEATVAARTNMGSAVLTGFGWKMATALLSDVTRVLVAIVLARLLTPADYGIAGMAFIFAGLANIFSDLALGGALVQRRAITEEDRSTVFWAALAFSFVVAGVLVGLSPLIADFFGRHEVEKLVAVLSASIPLSALTTTQVALLTRRLAYRSLEIRQMAGVLGGAATALALAAAGFGPWAIVCNSLAASAVSTALLWRLSPWRPQLIFSFTHLRSLSGFGLRLFGLRIMNYANLNADNTLVGRFAGASALGTYSLAYNVMFTPMLRVANPISTVVYPALARMQDDLPRMRKAWLRSKRLSASLLAPAFLFILVTAPDLVRVLFGEKWHAAVPVIQLLAVAGVAHSLVTLNWTVLQGTGQIAVAFRLGLLVSILTVGAFAVGVRWGAVGVAASYAAVKWPLVLIDTYVTTRTVRFSFREAVLAGGSILPHAIVAAAGAWGVRLALVDAGAPPALRLMAVIAAAYLLYLSLLLVAAPAFVAEVREILGQRFPRLARPLPALLERHLARAQPSPQHEPSAPESRPSGTRGYRPTALQKQLLLVALGDPDSAAEAWKSLPAGFSLDELEPGSFELMPLAYRNLSQTSPDDPRLPRLKGMYRRSWVKNNLLLGSTRQIAETLEAAVVPALFLEGPTYGARFYGDLALRPSSAVHLLVPAPDAPEASRQLEDQGWTTRPGSDAYPGWRVLFDTAGNICVLRSSLVFDYIGAGAGPSEGPLWQAAETDRVGDTEVLVPRPTDALLAACVAGARYGPLPPTQWLTDAVMILRASEVDWDRLIELAVTRGQSLRLMEALDCLVSLPIPVPERVTAARAWLARRSPTRRDQLVFALSSGRFARRGGLARALAQLLAATTGEPLLRTAARVPGHLCARWSVTHRWQLPLAAGRRLLGSARRT